MWGDATDGRECLLSFITQGDGIVGVISGICTNSNSARFHGIRNGFAETISDVTYPSRKYDVQECELAVIGKVRQETVLLRSCVFYPRNIGIAPALLLTIIVYIRLRRSSPNWTVI